MTRNLVPAEGIQALIDGWRKEASEFDGLAPLDVATLNRCADDLEKLCVTPPAGACSDD